MAEFPTAEELEVLFQEGKMERIGMGSRRACYALPGGKLCVKCYRSDAEIEEGKVQGRSVKQLPSAVVQEIVRYRADDRRNTSCQEYRYWNNLKNRLPSFLMEVFPAFMQLIFVSSRGWCLIEELIVNDDGTYPQTIHKKLLEPPSLDQKKVESSFKILIEEMATYSVRVYDPSNFLVQRCGSGFKLRLADIEPSPRTFLPVDNIFPSLISGKVQRRARRFLEFTRNFRTTQVVGISDEPVYVVRNHAGRPLVAWTDAFVRSDPQLAEKVVPIPIAEQSNYLEKKDCRLLDELRRAIADNECAWIFYPSKRDDVRTVFFIENCELFVRKTVGRRAYRFRRHFFSQREVAPLPIFRGESAAEKIGAFMRAGDLEGSVKAVIAFVENLIQNFSIDAFGRLPPCTFDAIPQNCIVSDNGKSNFFDLEYDMYGGVPLSYIIFRSISSTLFRIPSKDRLGFQYRECLRLVAEYFNVKMCEDDFHKINASIKRFNSFGVHRFLTNIWLSLLPVRSWRLRFCWWSMIPCKKEVCNG